MTNQEEMAVEQIAVGRDADAPGTAEEALRESEQRYRFLADAMPQIVWTARPDGSIDYGNQHWYDYTGLTFEQTRDRCWQAVLHPDDLPDFLARWTEALATGKPYEASCRLQRARDGAYRWHLARAAPRRDAAGRIIQWVGTCTDIHDQKLAEQALRESEAGTRGFLQDVLASVTEGRLRLCEDKADLPAPLPRVHEPFALSVLGLRQVRRYVEAVACDLGLSDERVQDLVTAVGEAIMNAVVHAGGGEALVCASMTTVQVWVRDTGKGIAIGSLHRATLERGFTTAGSLGYGFWMMLKTADRAWLLTGPEGTTVVLEQDRAKPTPTWLRELH